MEATKNSLKILSFVPRYCSETASKSLSIVSITATSDRISLLVQLLGLPVAKSRSDRDIVEAMERIRVGRKLMARIVASLSDDVIKYVKRRPQAKINAEGIVVVISEANKIGNAINYVLMAGPRSELPGAVRLSDWWKDFQAKTLCALLVNPGLPVCLSHRKRLGIKAKLSIN